MPSLKNSSLPYLIILLLVGLFGGLGILSRYLLSDRSSEVLVADPEPFFYCDQESSIPKTVVRIGEYDELVLFTWESDYFEPNYTAPQRCEIVSKRLTDYHNKGSLNYFSTGFINHSDVICASKENGGDCTSENILVTLRKGIDKNPQQVLLHILALQNFSNIEPIQQHGLHVIITDDQEVKAVDFWNYVNLDPHSAQFIK